MTDLRQAAQQALDALENMCDAQSNPDRRSFPTIHDFGKSRLACIAIKEALEQQQAEPVAWMYQHEETGRTAFIEMSEHKDGWKPSSSRMKLIGPLYTTPPQQQAEPFSPEAINATQTAWKMGYEAAKAEQQAEPVAWNKSIRDSVDSLLEQAGYQPDSSARHQLAMMNFDATSPQQQAEPMAWVFTPNNDLLWPHEVEVTNPIELNSYQPLYTAPPQPEQEPVRMPCVGKDPRCPCQDGDACHYKDCGDTKAWPVPQAEPTPWRDMVVVSLVREGIDKHKARELADHFAAQQAEPVACRFCFSEKGCWTWQCYHCGEIDDVQKPAPSQQQAEPVAKQEKSCARCLHKATWPITGVCRGCRFYSNFEATPPQQQAEPTIWRDMVVVSLVREGVNKHRARELADHFAAQQQAKLKEKNDH